MVSPALVVGADGLIGRTLTISLRANGLEVIETTRRKTRLGPDRVSLDLAEPTTDWAPPRPVEIAYICAAATEIKHCQENAEATARINVSHTFDLVRNLNSQNVFTVFLSTSGVYAGTTEPRGPDDLPTPVHEYARQKAGAERALAALGDGVAIVRLTKVFDATAPLFREWRENLTKGQVIHPFSDMTVSPLSTEFIALALERIGRDRLPGITQISGAKAITYAEIAHHIAGRMGVGEDLVQPILSSDAGIPAEWIQAATVLETRRMETELRLAPPDPFDVIDKILGLQQVAHP